MCEACLVQLPDKPIPAPVHQNLVYIAVLRGFSQEYSPDSLSNTLLSQGCILEELSLYDWRTGCILILQGQGKGLKSL